MTESPVVSERDNATLRRASQKIALRISAACALLVLCLLAGATIYLLGQAGKPEPTEPGGLYAYLDTKDLIKAMLIAGLAGILLAGGVGWVSARSAIRPLSEALDLQRRFVQDASHQMRTPLAILDARIQLAQRNMPSDSPSGHVLAQIRQDTAALSGIVNGLLEAATRPPLEPIAAPANIDEVVQAVVESLGPLANEQGIALECISNAKTRSLIDPQRLHRAVLALAENALAHTPRGGRIIVATCAAENHAVITVTDTGGGIIGIEPDRIFDRFARTNHPRTSQQPQSFGIGLSLVREIAIAAGGSADVAFTGPTGTSMRITLPSATN